MARANIYIRKEYELRWAAIEDKSAFVNLALAGTDVPIVNSAIKQKKEIEEILKPHLEKSSATHVELTPVPEPVEIRKRSSFIKPDLKYCKNGHAMDERGRCFGKGCKYA